MRIRILWLLIAPFFALFIFNPKALALNVKNIEITNYFVSIGGSQQTSADIFMKVDNGGDPDQLLSASSADCNEVKLVQKKAGDELTQLDKIDIPMDRQTDLDANAPHLVCDGIINPMDEGKSIKLLLKFAITGEVELYAPIRKLVNRSSSDQGSDQQKRSKGSRSRGSF